MKALILTGGLGTRLRPLTCRTPKPLLPLVNVPFLERQLRDLRRGGVKDVILAASLDASVFRRALGDGRRLGLRIRCVRERKPLGTGGAVRNADRFLDDTTLVLNGDVLQSLDVRALLRHHRRSRAAATVTLARVKDPTVYGLVETDPQDRIRRFLEKPSWDEVTCNTINAGAYIFERRVIEMIPPGIRYSLERGLFPLLLDRGERLFGFVNKGYWLDIGTVDKYLQAHLDILSGAAPFPPAGLKRSRGLLLGPGVRLGRELSRDGSGRVVLGRGTRVEAYVHFSGSVSVGPRCVVEQGAALEDCVVLGGTRIGKGARLSRCVIGRECRVGHHAIVGPGGALGDRSVVKKFSQL